MGLLTLLLTHAAPLPIQGGNPPRAAGTYNTYGDYALLFQRSAGQYYDSAGNVSGQWAWSPQSGTVSDIAWGDPTKWPPASAERFILSGNWLELDGYSTGQGQPVTEVQRVTSETMGSATCSNMVAIPSDNGRQHYVQWNIPTSGYCLDAKGTITSTVNGSVVHFEHKQQWGAATPCSNPYYSNQTCITQHEQWWDDNGHTYGLQLDRTQYIAKGRGMAFMIKQTYPSVWSANMHSNWNW